MSLSNLISQRITGINPFNELPIDENIWKEAHAQHQVHRQLHALAHHRPGVVYGLEVVALSGTKARVMVAPGVAVDTLGRTMLLNEPVFFDLTQTGQNYITIQYEDNFDSSSGMNVGAGMKYYRLVEGRQVTASTTRPADSQMELGRIDRSSATAAVKEAKNPFDPGQNEVNGLYRAVAFPHCYADGAMGELGVVPKQNPNAWKPNRAGLWNLIREGNGRGFHLDFIGPYKLRGAPTGEPPLMLYVAGTEGFQPLTDAEITGLGDYLNAGGFLCGEACGGSAEFKSGFMDLAKRLGTKLAAVPDGHHLYTAHHVFSGAPVGAQTKGDLMIDESGSLLFSSYDYGGAWQGAIGKTDPAEARERIRGAQEFGLNILAFAAYRRRQFELEKMTASGTKNGA